MSDSVNKIVIILAALRVVKGIESLNYDFNITKDHELFHILEKLAVNKNCSCGQDINNRYYEFTFNVDRDERCSAFGLLRNLNKTLSNNTDTTEPRYTFQALTSEVRKPDVKPNDDKEEESNVGVIIAAAGIGTTLTGIGGYVLSRYIKTKMQTGAYYVR